MAIWAMPKQIKGAMMQGDTFTISGVTALIPNPCKRWWQFWKPRMVDGGELQKFMVM